MTFDEEYYRAQASFLRSSIESISSLLKDREIGAAFFLAGDVLGQVAQADKEKARADRLSLARKGRQVRSGPAARDG